MFILSHDKKVLMDVQILHVDRNLGGRSDSKYAIVGTSNANDAFPKTLGFYPTEEAAIAELGRIVAAIEDGHKTYIISD